MFGIPAQDPHGMAVVLGPTQSKDIIITAIFPLQLDIAGNKPGSTTFYSSPRGSVNLMVSASCYFICE